MLSHRDDRADLRHPPIDFGEWPPRFAPGGARVSSRRAAAPAPFCASFSDASDSRALQLRGARHAPPARLAALALELFHPFLNPRVRIDQTFSSITHECAPSVMTLVSASPRLRQGDHIIRWRRGPAFRFSSARAVPSRHPPLVRRRVRRAHPAAGARLARHRRGESTLILAPTGSGKTLTAFLWCLDRVMFGAPPDKRRRCRVLYISPLKALAVDVERNLRAPLAGIARIAASRGDAYRDTGRLDSDRRHAGVGAGALPARSRGHPDYDARVALSAPDLERARRPPKRRHDHHRRDPRARADQARRAPGGLDRAAGGAVRTAAAANRPLGDAAATRRGGAVPRRRQRAGRDRAASQGRLGPLERPAALRPGRGGGAGGQRRRGDRRRVLGACRSCPLPAGHDRRRRREQAVEPPDRRARSRT